LTVTYRGPDDSEYISIPDAARILDTTESEVQKHVMDGLLHPVDVRLLKPPSHRPRGRPPDLMVSLTEVDVLRRERLARLGGVDAPDGIGLDGLRERAAQLETELAAARAQCEALLEALRLSLVVDGARVDQIRELIAPMSPTIDSMARGASDKE
jgi:hypothetical protein